MTGGGVGSDSDTCENRAGRGCKREAQRARRHQVASGALGLTFSTAGTWTEGGRSACGGVRPTPPPPPPLPLTQTHSDLSPRAEICIVETAAKGTACREEGGGGVCVEGEEGERRESSGGGGGGGGRRGNQLFFGGGCWLSIRLPRVSLCCGSFYIYYYYISGPLHCGTPPLSPHQPHTPSLLD